MLLAVAGHLLAEVPVRSRGFGDARTRLEDVPCTPPCESRQARVPWSWWPLVARCVHLDPENGDAVAAALAWRDTVLVA